MASALDRVMNQAEEASANLPAPSVNQNLVPAGNYSAPARPSLDAMADSAGIQVDHYVTVKDTGFRIGDNKSALFQTFTGELDLNEVAAIVSVRANRAGATEFIKSYDGATTSQGQSFQQATDKLRATYEKVDGPYATAEIPITLTSKAGDAKVGERVGVTPSITGVKFWTRFYNELRRQNLQTGVVQVKVTHVPQSNKNGNEWGVASFELIEG